MSSAESTEATGQPLWAGRFGEGPSDELLAFTVSLPFDRRLAGDDLAGSRAHVHMLERVGLIDEQERQVITAALGRVEEELVDGTFAFAPTDEDIHTAIERRVTEIAGATGAKLHTGRSRNDQVALDLRLYVRREAHVQAARIHELQTVLVRRAEEAADVYLPGYTHLQRAQPVLLAHHLLAHFWALDRDLDRWRDCVRRADVSPLGAGALAGSSLPLDPDLVANELGFPARFANSLDAVSDRDFVAEALFVATLTQVHLSRIGEEIVLWSTEEFGFLRLAAGELGDVGVLLLRQHRRPGAVRVGEPQEAELLAGPQHDLLAEPRQVHLGEGGDEERLGDEVAVGHRVERVVEAPGEPELGRGRVGVERQARSGQRARAQR